MLKHIRQWDKRRKITLAVVLIGIGWLIVGRGHHDDADSASGKQGKGGTVPIAVAPAQSGDIPVYLTQLGSVTPRSVVTVHTLVNGELLRLHFSEGQLVKKDDLLAEIDDRPYAAALKQAEGALARDAAQLEQAKIDLSRYQLLWKQDSIAKQQLDAQAALVRQYEGAVLNDQGQVDAARVNVSYTKILAPVSGRVGLRQVDAGNIVHTNDANGIVVVTEQQPITALFTIPEDNIPALMKYMQGDAKLTVEAWDRANTSKLATGVLVAVDNQVDATTGTVKARAEFGNEDNALFPSQFVTIRLQLHTLKDAVTIPTAAVQRGVKGAFVYVLKPDSTVAVQTITLGAADGEHIAVLEGLNVGDEVVVDGVDNLRDGAKVKVAPSKEGESSSKK